MSAEVRTSDLAQRQRKVRAEWHRIVHVLYLPGL